VRFAIVLNLLYFVGLGHAQTRSAGRRFEATADSTDGITAKGTVAHEGVVAADPAVLPLGSVIRVSGAGQYSGTYVVTDTGSKVAGRHIDIYLPSVSEAKQFGKKVVTVRVVSKGDNQKDHKEVTPAASH
jgi:rare lipoprotein A